MDDRRGRRLADGIDRGLPFGFLFEGRTVTAYPGETIAAALVADGALHWRTSRSATPRGLYCGMGVCWDCLVVVEGRPAVRACMTAAEPGTRVSRALAPELDA